MKEKTWVIITPFEKFACSFVRWEENLSDFFTPSLHLLVARVFNITDDPSSVELTSGH